MNMQDYRRAADRVHIAEHCKEEVLNMTTAKTNRKPVMHLLTGITAAAACLGIVGAFALAFHNMKPDQAPRPAATQMEEQTAFSAASQAETTQITEQTLPAENGIDEFPLLKDVKERTKTFDWGTIYLEPICRYDVSGYEQDGNPFFQCELQVHINDDVYKEINEGDVLEIGLTCWMYDQSKQHKVGSGIPQEVKARVGLVSHDHNLSFKVNFPAPKAGKVICMTLGEDGQYHEEYSDFLEKQPLPEYLLYEIQLDKVVVREYANENPVAMKSLLFSQMETPLFKFRVKDLPAETHTEVQMKDVSTAEIAEEETGEEVMVKPDNAPEVTETPTSSDGAVGIVQDDSGTEAIMITEEQ